MEFSRPEYQSGYSFPSPGDLPNPEIKPRSHALQADSLPAEPQGKPKNTGVGKEKYKATNFFIILSCQIAENCSRGISDYMTEFLCDYH